VQSGHGVAYFKAADGLDVHTKAEIILEVRPPRATSLSAAIDMEVIALPEATGPHPGSVPTPNINPRWVKEGDQLWRDEGWNRTSVAKVTREEDSVDIWVSADNEKLSSLIARAQRRDITAVDTVKSLYLEHVSYFALLQDLDRSQGTDGGASESQETTAAQTLRHACDTVCGIIESLFDIIVATPSVAI
jgi:hypothetical protein